MAPRLPSSPEHQSTSQGSDADTGGCRERRQHLGSVRLSEIVRLGIVTRWPLGAVMQGHLEHLRQMQGLAVGSLGNLFAAAKAVRNESVSLSAWRTAGSSSCSPTASDTS
jgi:hypothetical protein